MLSGVIEQNAESAVLTFIEEINSRKEAWGFLRVKREYLQSVSNAEFIVTAAPALQNAGQARIFFSDGATIYIVWSGMLKQICRDLTAIIGQSLFRQDSPGARDRAITYFDTAASGGDLKSFLKTELQPTVVKENNLPEASRAAANLPPVTTPVEDCFEATPKQIAHYKQAAQRKQNRPKPYILMVEDQAFLRKLLQEALHDHCVVDACATAEKGWTHYLDAAPDIALLDIGLPEADGHMLAHRIKEFDPEAYVVMISANRQPVNIEKARQNHVDGFIAKPFSRKKIDECIGRYIATHKGTPKTAH